MAGAKLGWLGLSEAKPRSSCRRINRAPAVLGDLDGDGIVGVPDLLTLLAAWGPCVGCANCPADLDGDCAVSVPDLLTLLANWG